MKINIIRVIFVIVTVLAALVYQLWVAAQFTLVPSATAAGAAQDASQAALPEGYVRRTQPTPAPSRGNTTQSLLTTGKVYRVGFSTGDEVMSGLSEWAEKNGVTSGYIIGIGGFNGATFGWVDPNVRGGLKKIKVDEKVEVDSFTGNFTPGPEGKTNVHVHALVTGGDGVAKGGHLISAQVDPTMELYVTELAPAGAPQVPQGK